MGEHGGIVHHAVGCHAHDKGQGAAKTHRGGFDGIAHQGVRILGGIVSALLVVFHFREMGKHLGNGLLGLVGRGLVDGLLGKHIGAAQNGRAQQAGEAQDRHHIGKIGFNCHNYFLPNFFCLNHMLSSGTTEFMIRMAKETPSG